MSNKGLRLFLSMLGFALAGHAGVLPPTTVIGGKSVPELEMECWKWIYSISTNANPMVLCEGQLLTNSQPRADVFFIAPVNGLRPAACSRVYTIPEDTYILVPILPVTYENIDTDPPLSIPEFHDILDSVLNEPAFLKASIDGVALTNLIQYRATTPAFDYTFPDADNTQSMNYRRPISGLQEPTVADGYWFLLEPLPPGPHRIVTSGDLSVPLFFPRGIDCTITVVPVSLPDRIEILLGVLTRSELPSKEREPLVNALKQAKRFFEAQKLEPGMNQVRSFQKELSKGLDREDPDLFSQLNERAGRILEKAKVELRTSKK